MDAGINAVAVVAGNNVDADDNDVDVLVSMAVVAAAAVDDDDDDDDDEVRCFGRFTPSFQTAFSFSFPITIINRCRHLSTHACLSYSSLCAEFFINRATLEAISANRQAFSGFSRFARSV